MDEIIVIDGSAKGPSTDRTAEIVKSFEKVKYLSGTYQTRSNAWDIAAQRNHGINEATGDIILFVSADMLFYDFEYFNDIIRKDEDGKVFFCPTIEFWGDVNHIRLYEQVKSLSILGGVNEAVAISKDLQPIAGEHGTLEVVTPKAKEQVLIVNTIKYHLGWIRPFRAQVDKHIRHVEQGRWGDIGAKLLQGPQQKLEQWAFLHVLSYKQNPSVELKFDMDEEWESIKDMNYLEGQNEALKEYEKQFGSSVFRGTKV